MHIQYSNCKSSNTVIAPINLFYYIGQIFFKEYSYSSHALVHIISKLTFQIVLEKRHTKTIKQTSYYFFKLALQFALISFNYSFFSSIQRQPFSFSSIYSRFFTSFECLDQSFNCRVSL